MKAQPSQKQNKKMIRISALKVHSVESDEHSTTICLHTVCGCLPAAVAELDSYERDYMACGAYNIHSLSLSRKSVPIPSTREGKER